MSTNMEKNDDQYFMQLAIAEARKGKAEGELPFANVIVRNNEVIATNHCQEGRLKDVTTHSELLTVSDACRQLKTNNLSDCTIYCTNEPCLMCASAIFQAKIGKLVIGADRSDIAHIARPRKLKVEDLINDLGYKAEVVSGVLREEVIALFKDIKK